MSPSSYSRYRRSLPLLFYCRALAYLNLNLFPKRLAIILLFFQLVAGRAFLGRALVVRLVRFLPASITAAAFPRRRLVWWHRFRRAAIISLPFSPAFQGFMPNQAAIETLYTASSPLLLIIPRRWINKSRIICVAFFLLGRHPRSR